jgi:hypothetical protein
MAFGRFGVVAGLAAITWVALGCSDDGTRFGAPGGLLHAQLPTPNQQGDDGGGGPPPPPLDGGGVTDAGGGGDSVVTGDAGPCQTSWSKDIYVNATGAWDCTNTAQCHGGLQPPRMTADPSGTYATLVAYTLQMSPKKLPNGSPLPFIQPGSTDPTVSGIECLLAGNTCGTQMPNSLNGVTGTPLTQAQILNIDSWVKCGSPNN